MDISVAFLTLSVVHPCCTCTLQPTLPVQYCTCTVSTMYGTHHELERIILQTAQDSFLAHNIVIAHKHSLYCQYTNNIILQCFRPL